MSNIPVPTSPPSRKKTRPASFGRVLILAAILAALVLTGMAGNQPIGQTLFPTTSPVAGQLTLMPTPIPAGTTAADETTGIILAGAFLVLIVLGGTLGASRRKS